MEAASSTLTDHGSRAPLDPERAVLIYVGSPEDGFLHAGRCISLVGLDRVHFGRAQRGEFDVQRDGAEVRVSIPFPWVSSAHAELRLDRRCARSYLADLGSRNGTLLERRAVVESEIATGEMFEIGRSFWVVQRLRHPLELEPCDLDSTVVQPLHRGVLHELREVASTRAPILLLGETGTGKGHLARAIHASLARDGPFVQIEVITLAAESEPVMPLFEAARGGTLFLDDVGELALADQAHVVSGLSRVLGTASASPLGVADIRVISSSTRDLQDMVATETFRPDLYRMLSVWSCRIPPLRERREDLGLLVDQLARDAEGRALTVATDAFREITAHGWPFNVRELRHTLALAGDKAGRGHPISVEALSSVAWKIDGMPGPGRIQAVREALVEQLVRNRGDVLAVARSLRCEPGDVERWVERFELRRAQ